MRRARRWASVALCSLVAASLCVTGPGPARAADEVLGWDVRGYVEGGGIYVWGNRDSAKFDQYRDMDSGFLSEILLKADKKDSPYFFGLYLLNPGRDDMLGEGAFGRYGTFKLEGGWDRTPQVFSNSARTIYQQNSDWFNLPPTLWPTIATIEQGGVNNINNIAATINGLARPVDLSFNNDVGRVALKYTPTEDLRIDLEYVNIHKEGSRPLGLVIGSPGGSPNELAVPIDNWTSEVRVGAEWATANWGLRFNYVGSFFSNDFTGYSRDNPLTTVNSANTTAFDRISFEPGNSANTFSLTGTVGLPLRTRINGNFSYTMLRQDQSFEYNTLNPALAQSNTDNAGNRSPDAAVNILQFNLLATSRPINMLGITARYRIFDYDNSTPVHQFGCEAGPAGCPYAGIFPTGIGPNAQFGEGTHEAYTTQNAGIDFSLRPLSMLMLRAGYEWVHWKRKDYEEQDFTNTTNIFKLSGDVTPTDWFLGRLTYAYASRSLSGFDEPPTSALPNSAVYMWAPVKTNRLDALFQFSFWETVIPSLNASYSNNNFNDNDFGLLKNNYWSVGFDVTWTPAKALSTSLDFSYERYNYDMANRYLVGGTFPGIAANDWASTSQDKYYNVGAQVVWDVIPKTFSVNVGYFGSFGNTTITTSNPNFNPAGTTPPGTSNPQAVAYDWPEVKNNRQTVTLIAKYYLTQKLSLRAGFAYEKFNTQDFARDPMAPFMGFYDANGTNPVSNTLPNTSGVQSVYLGNTYGNYEAYIISAFVRYDF